MLRVFYQHMTNEIRMVLPYGVPSLSKGKTVGQLLENEYNLLQEDAKDELYCKTVGKENAVGELKKFEKCRLNIQHAAATLIQKGMWRAYIKNHGLIGPARLRQPNASATFDDGNDSEYEYGNEYDLYSDYFDDEEEKDDHYYYNLWLQEQEVNAYRDKECNPYD